MEVTNPYSDIVKLMQQHGAKNNPYSIQLASVVTSSPLSILVGELLLNKENLLVADYLLKNYTRVYSLSGNIKLSESGSLGPTDSVQVGDHGSHAHTVTGISLDTNNTQSGDLTFTDTLLKDDLLAVVQANISKFIILARVVSA